MEMTAIVFSSLFFHPLNLGDLPPACASTKGRGTKVRNRLNYTTYRCRLQAFSAPFPRKICVYVLLRYIFMVAKGIPRRNGE